MKRYRFRILGVLILVLAALWWGWNGVQNQLILVNHSGQTISSLIIEIPEKTLTFTSILDGHEKTSVLPIHEDEQMLLTGHLSDGTIVKGSYRHMLKGILGERLKITVKRGGSLEFEKK